MCRNSEKRSYGELEFDPAANKLISLHAKVAFRAVLCIADLSFRNIILIHSFIMMKSSLKKLRDFTLSKNGGKDKRSAAVSHDHIEDQVEWLSSGMQALTDMREQYDGLLAAAQSISGSSYDFSRSIHEMASYMLETFGRISDGDTGNSFSMLGKVQFEISKQLDLYAAHVSQTIIKPTEKLLKELQSVEEVKEKYDEKRELYNEMRLLKTKGRRKKGDALDQQLMSLKAELKDQATVLELLFQSLSHGRDLSLITQAARHHMAQVHLFSKGLNSLNAVDSIMKRLSNELHIDETLSEGDAEFQMDENSPEADISGVVDEEDSTHNSPSSCSPMTRERIQHASPSISKSWQGTSKSAPLNPSLIVGIPLVQNSQAERPAVVTTYALPSPTHPSTRSHNQAAATAVKAQLGHYNELVTRSSTVSEEAKGLAELSDASGQRQIEIRHAVAREEDLLAWKENKGIHLKAINTRKSPSHSYSTSYSEGLDPLSGFSTNTNSGSLASTPTFSYKRVTKENVANLVPVTHVVDPLYRSGPIARSASSWGFAPSRISPSASPPMSHLSPPVISELHKLPAPPQLPRKVEPMIMHSAPLGMKVVDPGRQSAATPPLQASALAIVKKSRSIPSSVSFSRSLSHNKIIRSDDSPFIESP